MLPEWEWCDDWVQAERALVHFIGNEKLNRALPRLDSFCLEVPALRFYDGLADGQARSHRGVLGRKKVAQEMRKMRRIGAWAAVFDHAANRFSQIANL